MIFADGVYPLTSTLSWTAQGTADSPIVLRAAEGGSPVLELVKAESGNFEAGQVAYLYEASFFEIRGLSFRGGEGWDQDGVGFSGLVVSQTSDVLLHDVEIGQTGSHSLGTRAAPKTVIAQSPTCQMARGAARGCRGSRRCRSRSRSGSSSRRRSRR